jgi:hypothetical protein
MILYHSIKHNQIYFIKSRANNVNRLIYEFRLVIIRIESVFSISKKGNQEIRDIVIIG